MGGVKLLFVRHSIALERDEWRGEDLLRPLSKKGEEEAKAFFKEIARIYPKTSLILSSKATRAIRTAELLGDAIKDPKIVYDLLLNPGCSFNDFKSCIKKQEGAKSLFIVGHEPDFSEIISAICSNSLIAMRLKKPSLVEVVLRDDFKGEMISLFGPKIFR